MWLFFTILGFLTFHALAQGMQVPNNGLSARVRPVIGILSIPVDSSSDDVNYSRIDNSYVRWLESAGAMVVPIFFNETESHIEAQFHTLSGVLFTGGPDKPTDFNRYFQTATNLYNLSVKYGMPLWGTCLGFQTISDIAGGGVDVLSDYDAEDLELPLQLTEQATSSKLFGNMPSEYLALFTDANYTTNWHHYGVSPQTFAQQLEGSSEGSEGGLRALSVNADRGGLLFVSSLEHSFAPIFATQFHPEANAHDRDHEVVNHSTAAVHAMQYLAAFFVEQARALGLGPGDVAGDNMSPFTDIETFPLEGTKYILA